MNELEAIGTNEQGNTLIFYGYQGHLYYWEKIGPGEMRLDVVDTVEGVEQEYDAWTTLEELPNNVRGAVIRSNWEMRSTKTTLEGAMAGD